MTDLEGEFQLKLPFTLSLRTVITGFYLHFLRSQIKKLGAK